jgi:hypothetical protein
MFTNIPKNSITNIINDILRNNREIKDKIRKEITHVLQTLIDQNYFPFDLEYYKHSDGLAMGAPNSAILAETYSQDMEHIQIYHT